MKLRIPALLLLLGAAALAQKSPPRPAPSPFEKGIEPPRADHTENLPRLVQVTVELIETSQTDANRLLYKEKLGKDGDRLRAELQKMVDEGKATLLETLGATGRSGNTSTAESILEVIYPTEYSPPGLPGTTSAKSGSDETTVQNTSSNGFPTPTAFQTRNTGSTLEIQPTLADDNRTIALRVVPELVFKTGNVVYGAKKDSLGNESKMEMPLFYAMRTSTAVTLTDGGTLLLALLSPKSADGTADLSKKAFLLVRADVVVVKPVAPKP